VLVILTVSSEKDALGKATHNALKMMKDAGFEISNTVKVVVDPKLPFMGYSTKRNGGDIIVISGMALKSGMVEGLLVHEMSHIYRINTNHPSHDHELLDRVGRLIIDKNHLTRAYQIKIIQQAVNHIQDLYADDLAFRVFSQSGAFPPDQAFSFFTDWINDKPAGSRSTRDAWLNIGIMLDNCFALSNMIRHNVPDVNNQAENKAEKFLAQTNERMKEEFTYFKDFMTNLRENITEKEFEEELTDYLMKIIRLAQVSINLRFSSFPP
jgi:hypothetical protein